MLAARAAALALASVLGLVGLASGCGAAGPGKGDGGEPAADAGPGGDGGPGDDGGPGSDGGPGDGGGALDAGATDGGGPADGGATDAGAPDGGLFGARTSLDDGGVLRLHTALPARTADCAAPAPCDDLDRDGLVDAWEGLVLERYRPRLVLDEKETLVTEPAFALHFVGRVFPADAGTVRALVMIGYAKDYGSCGFTAHNGDSERIAFELAFVPDGGPGEVALRQAYTAAHEGTVTDHSRRFGPGELRLLTFVADAPSGEPRWAVFPSNDKHGTYASKALCEAVSTIPCLDEDCAPDGVADPSRFERLPPFVNAGEPNGPLVTALDAYGFPGEDAWSTQRFCGGLGGLTCSSAVREKLVNDPF